MSETKAPAAAISPAEIPKPRLIQWAADLVAALKASGTGESTLNVIRGEMVALHSHPAHTKLKPSHPDRHLTAREAVAILGRDLPGHTVTIEKARQLAETGIYIPPPPPTRPVDLLPPPPECEAPERELPAAEEQPRAIAGPDKIPGVHNVAADVDTIGPKPVGTRKLKVGS